MITDRIKDILMLYNLIDDILIVNKDGIIVYSETFKRGAYSFDMSQTVGMHLFDAYPTSNETTSTLFQVIKTQEPVLNYETTWTSFKGDVHSGIADTLPIFENGEFAGAVEIAKFNDDSKRQINIIDANINYTGKSLYTIDDIITRSPGMNLLKEKISKVARTKSPVMIYGETGTGKEMVAQSIHSQGKRSAMPFISQNCSSIPTQLLESILFGTQKGGFTGAVSRKGLFELANHGTLFLDEINSMDLNSQSKILKAIEEQKIMRVGGDHYIDVDVRITCALNEKPSAAVKQGKLREDLFYRLSAVVLSIPPLRQREEDLELLIDLYIKKYAEIFNNPLKGVTDQALSLFKAYHWPGNVRELKNVIEGAFNLSNNQWLDLNDIPEYIVEAVAGSDDPSPDTTRKIENICEKEKEKEALINALNNSKNKAQAARTLGISKQLLNYRIKKYDIGKKDV